MTSRNERLSPFNKIPFLARQDHRHMLNSKGELAFISKLPRNERRQIKKEGIEISKKYNLKLRQTLESGAGFPQDRLLRSLAAEYIHRLASSGTENFPVSFNYFEPFLTAKIFGESYAPYFDLKAEVDHLFEFSDFLEYVTSDAADLQNARALEKLPESQVFHFTTNGDIFETTIYDEAGREFIVSGFSMMRISSRIHWYLIGGEVLSEEAWNAVESHDISEGIKFAPPWKRAFLGDMAKRNGGASGKPLPLEGTQTAVRTIIAGEFDFNKSKHISRLYMSELENSFSVFTDDPEIFGYLAESKIRDIHAGAIERLSEAGPLWNIAEAFFQMPDYFAMRLVLPDRAGEYIEGARISLKKGGRGTRRLYRYIKSTEIGRKEAAGSIAKVVLPQFEIETSGYWRRLGLGAKGKDENGNPVEGKTWVKSENKWRAENRHSGVVFVKDTIKSARQSLERLLTSKRVTAARNQATAVLKLDKQELYVLRCATMAEEVYKVGWTDGSAIDRAKELSSASGVPEAFIVVAYWKHRDAKALETEVHAALAPFRVSNNREFFRARFSLIEGIIENAIQK